GPGRRVGGPRGPPRHPRTARGRVAHGRQSLHVRRELHPVTGRGAAMRLGRLGLPHARARATAVLLAGVGLAAALAALGVRLAPRVAGVIAAWLAIAGVAAVAAWAARRVRRATAPPELGRLAEREGGGRAGSVVGVLAPPPRLGGLSASLLALADAGAATALPSRSKSPPLRARRCGPGGRASRGAPPAWRSIRWGARSAGSARSRPTYSCGRRAAGAPARSGGSPSHCPPSWRPSS